LLGCVLRRFETRAGLDCPPALPPLSADCSMVDQPGGETVLRHDDGSPGSRSRACMASPTRGPDAAHDAAKLLDDAIVALSPQRGQRPRL